VSQRLSTEIPDCRVVTMPDVGRLVPEEAPHELSELIATFVSPHIRGFAQEIIVGSDGAGTTEGGSA